MYGQLNLQFLLGRKEVPSGLSTLARMGTEGPHSLVISTESASAALRYWGAPGAPGQESRKSPRPTDPDIPLMFLRAGRVQLFSIQSFLRSPAPLMSCVMVSWRSGNQSCLF